MAALPESVADLIQQEGGSSYFLAPGDTWDISDTAANIETLTPAEIIAASSNQVSAFTATDTSVVLSLAQALAFNSASISLTVPAGDSLIVADTAATLEDLSQNQINELASIGVTQIAATNTPAVLNSSRMNELSNAGIAVIAPPNDPSQNDGTTVISGPTGDGMTFDISWDSSVASAPANYKTDIEEAFQFYADMFNTGTTTLYYDVGYGERHNAVVGSGDLGESNPSLIPTSYSALVAAMSEFPVSQVQDEAVASLPASDPTGGLNLYVPLAEAQILGLPNSAGTSLASPDGYIGFSSFTGNPFNYSPDPNQVPVAADYDFLGAVEHEISEVMGRVSLAGGGGNYSPMDLFRYSVPGQLNISPYGQNNSFGNGSYFSIDEGGANLGDWNNYTSGDHGDLGDWEEDPGGATNPDGSSIYLPDSYNDASNAGIINPITASDVALMNALGYDVATPTADPTFAPNPPIVDDLFFDGYDASGNDALWVSRGSAATTHELTGVNGIAGDVVTASDITTFGTEILFNGTDLNGNDGLWVSNGTAAGTHQITGIANVESAAKGGLDPSGLALIATTDGNEVFFNGTDASGQVGIWETDGTAAGTHELVPGVSAGDMTVYGGGIVFAGSDGGLWATDGTPAGTYEIGGAPGSSLGEFGGENLTAPDGLHPYGLVFIDGDLLFGGSGQYTYNANGVSGTIDTNFLFSLDSSTFQAISGIAPAGTTHTTTNDLLGEEPADTPGPILVAPVTVQGGTVLEALFQGDDFLPGYSGGGLDAYDPFNGTLSLVAGFTPSLNNDIGGPDPVDLTSVDGLFVFNGQGLGVNNDFDLTDGVSSAFDLNDADYDNSGGQLVTDDAFTGAQTTGLGLNPSEMTVYNGNVYFNGFDAAGQQGLWELTTNNFFTAAGPEGGPNFESEKVDITATGAELTGISGANPDGIDPSDITALYVAGAPVPNALPITIGQLLLDLTMDQINPGSNNAPTGYAYIVTDTAFDIESLTPQEIAAGEAIGVEELYSTDTSVVLDVAQAEALEDPVSVVVPSGDTVTVADSATDIEGMSLQQLSGLAAIDVSTITAVDTSVTLTVAQAVALEDPVLVTAPSGDTVTIADSAADIEGLTPAEIAALPSIGVTGITSLDASVVLQPLQAQALADASIQIAVPSGDTITTDYAYDLTAAEIEALTPAEIAEIAANAYTSIASTDASVVLQPLQAQALEDSSLVVTAPSGDTVTTDYAYKLTAAEVEALTPAAISAISANEYTSIASTGGSVALSIDQAVAVNGLLLNVTVPQNDTLSFGDTAANIEALTAANIAALSNFATKGGVTVLQATDASVVFTVAEAQALEGAPFHVTATMNHTVTIADTLTAIELLLNSAQLDALAAVGVSGFTTSGTLTLTVAEATALEGAGLEFLVPVFPATLVVSISDTAAHIEQLTAAQISGFGPDHSWGNGFNAITATDGSVTLTIAQAVALATSTHITVPVGDTVTIADTAADIEALTSAQVATLYQAGWRLITADGPVQLTASEAATIEGANLLTPLDITGATVTLEDTAHNIEHLSAAQLGALQSIGVSAITASGGSIAFSVAQAEAVPDLYLSMAPNETVTIRDSAANIEAFLASGEYEIGAVAQFDGVSGIVSTDGSVAVTAAAAEALEDTNVGTTIPIDVPTGDTVTLVDTAADIGGMSSSQIAALPSIGVTAIAVTDPSLSVSDAEALENGYLAYVNAVAPGTPLPISGPDGQSLALTDTAANIENMSAAQLSELTSIGVTTVDVTDQSLTLTVEQAEALDDPVPIYVPPGDTVIVADTESEIESLTPTEISQLAAIGVKTVEVTGPLNGESLTINGGITLSISGAVPSGETITFTGNGGTLAVEDTAGMAGTIYGFSPPDTMDLTDIPYDTSGGAVPGTDPGDGQQAIVVTENSNTYYLDIDPSQVFPTGEAFNLNPDSVDGTDLTASEPPAAGLFQIFGGTTDGIVIDGLVQVFGGTINRAIIQSDGELQNYGGTINDTAIGSGGLLDLSFADAATGTIDFGPVGGGVGGTLEIDDGAPELTATITGFAVGDTIDRTNVPYDASGSAGLGNDPNNNVPAIQINENGGTYYLDVDPSQDFLNQTFVLARDSISSPNPGTEITLDQTPIDTAVAIASGLTVEGASVISGGSVAVQAAATLDYGIINAGGVVDVQTGGSVGTGISFGTEGGTLKIDGPAPPNATVYGFAPGDTIDLTAVPYDGSSGSPTLELGNDLQFTENGTPYNLQFDPSQDFTGDYFHLALDANSRGTDITENSTPCYCRGTLIRTNRGQKRVEKLKIGDKVKTMSGVARPIKWIGRRSYSGRFALGRKDILPICIRAGALDKNVPRRNLWISPHHAMYLEGVLIEAKDLVNGVSIVQAERPQQVEYFHIELETHDVIVAEGALSETFIDDDSRGIFHNAQEYRLLYPNPNQDTVPACYCAPRLETGYQVDAAQRRIALRAGLLRAADLPRLGALRGYVDLISPGCIAGWAQDSEHPEAPVCLDIYVGDELIGQTLANRYREDLQRAGLGSGSHSFEFSPPGGATATVEVRRHLDGAVLKRREGCIAAPKPASAAVA